MNNKQRDICSPHLDALHDKLTRALAPMKVLPHFVDDLMVHIAPAMHAAVEDALATGEDISRAVVPAEMV